MVKLRRLVEDCLNAAAGSDDMTITVRSLLLSGLAPHEAVMTTYALARRLRAAGVSATPCPDRVMEDVMTAQRNRRIRETFNGRNHAVLAARHGLHVRTIRKILERGE